MNLRFGILGVIFLFVGGCVSTPTSSEQATADYGDPISQMDAEAKAKEFLQKTLKDPMSAVIEFDAISKGWREGALGRKPTYGYLLDASVNAKNSFGGYTGSKPYQFLFRDGALISIYAQTCLAPGNCLLAPIK